MTTPAERATPLLAVAGPTAVGKSAAVLDLADLLAHEGVRFVIVSADSRQVFRGFDIGTDKITVEERARHPHAGIDVTEADRPFTLYDWLSIARDAITSGGNQAQPELAVVVGGTGLYHRGLLRGFLSGGARPHDAELRQRLERTLEDEGRDYLQAQLHALHPKAADAVATASARRLIRSLEIVQLGGDPMAVEEDPWPAPYAYVLLDRPDKPAHREAIAARAARQFAAGLVAEAELLAARLAADTPALSGIGYREALLYRRGEIDEQKAIALSAARSWEYARRQSTWFRSEPMTATIHADPNRSVRHVANELLDHVHTIMSRRSG